jgi:hypothetical protein
MRPNEGPLEAVGGCRRALCAWWNLPAWNSQKANKNAALCACSPLARSGGHVAGRPPVQYLDDRLTCSGMRNYGRGVDTLRNRPMHEAGAAARPSRGTHLHLPRSARIQCSGRGVWRRILRAFEQAAAGLARLGDHRLSSGDVEVVPSAGTRLLHGAGDQLLFAIRKGRSRPVLHADLVCGRAACWVVGPLNSGTLGSRCVPG